MGFSIEKGFPCLTGNLFGVNQCFYQRKVKHIRSKSVTNPQLHRGKTSGYSFALVKLRVLRSLRWSNTSTSTEKIELTGRWSERFISARPYESCRIPLPRHNIRSHLHWWNLELLFLTHIPPPCTSIWIFYSYKNKYIFMIYSKFESKRIMRV